MSDTAGVLESPQLRALLQLLADGKFHSGEELGALLGVSRAAVWKRLQKLELLGITLVSARGRGYCIEGGLDLIDVQSLTAGITCDCPGLLREIVVLPSVDSTNAYLLGLADSSYRVCVAESQTAGRGRRGRSWVSPFAQNIYLSMAWGFDGGLAALEGLSLAVGVALVRSLAREGVVGVQLKWPNDVLYEQKKLAGILIEMSGDPTGYCRVVVGVGLNVSMANNLAGAITQPWTDVGQIVQAQQLVLPRRTQLTRSIIAELVELLSTYAKTGFAGYSAEWHGLNAYANQSVVLSSANSEHRGVMQGVTAAGALILLTEQGEEIFHGGELSLRSAP